jgi:hypothetical protein
MINVMTIVIKRETELHKYKVLLQIIIMLLVLISLLSAGENLYSVNRWYSVSSESLCDSVDGESNRQANSTNIKVLSFNIAGDSKNWERRKSACYDLINTRKPDIIGFQELLPGNLQWVLGNFPELEWYGLTIEGSSEGFPTDVEGESCRIMYNGSRFSADSSNSGAFWFSLTPTKCNTSVFR